MKALRCINVEKIGGLLLLFVAHVVSTAARQQQITGVEGTDITVTCINPFNTDMFVWHKHEVAIHTTILSYIVRSSHIFILDNVYGGDVKVTGETSTSHVTIRLKRSRDQRRIICGVIGIKGVSETQIWADYNITVIGTTQTSVAPVPRLKQIVGVEGTKVTLSCINPLDTRIFVWHKHRLALNTVILAYNMTLSRIVIINNVYGNDVTVKGETSESYITLRLRRSRDQRRIICGIVGLKGVLEQQIWAEYNITVIASTSASGNTVKPVTHHKNTASPKPKSHNTTTTDDGQSSIASSIHSVIAGQSYYLSLLFVLFYLFLLRNTQYCMFKTK